MSQANTQSIDGAMAADFGFTDLWRTLATCINLTTAAAARHPSAAGDSTSSGTFGKTKDK